VTAGDGSDKKGKMGAGYNNLRKKKEKQQCKVRQRECSGFARVNKVTSASLGYPLSVFNKNSTLTCGRGLLLKSLLSYLEP